MVKASVWLAALAITLTTASVISPGNQQNAAYNNNPALNSAYRDGIYRGQLAVQRRESPRFATSRWVLPAERKAFADGYDQAYRNALAAAIRDGNLLGQLQAEEERNADVTTGR